MVKRLILIIITAIIFTGITGCRTKLAEVANSMTFTVSGSVTDADGNPVKDVDLRFSGGYSGRARIKEDGSWIMPGLKNEVTITPFMEGWTFSPASITVREGSSGLDFIGNKSWYAINFDVEGEGSVEPDLRQDSYTYGTKLQLKAVPDKGWDFIRWEGDVEGSKNPHEIVMDGPKDVKAVFKRHGYLLDVNISGQGTVSKSVEQDAYFYGTSIELTAVASEGWIFSHWEGSTTGSNSTEKLVIKGNEKITAVFKKIVDSKNGGIAISFDDRSVDEWYSLMELFSKYNARATFFVNYFDKLSDSQIEKLKSMQSRGNEIGYHGLYHLNAVKYVTENSIDEYLNVEILPGVNLMREKGLNIESFAYPGGAGNKKIDRVLLNHFKRIRYTTYTYSPKTVKDLKEIYYKGKTRRVVTAVGLDDSYNNSLEDILKGIDKACKQNSVIMFYGHVPSNKPGVYNVNLGMLEEILKYAHGKGMRFYTISQLGT